MSVGPLLPSELLPALPKDPKEQEGPDKLQVEVNQWLKQSKRIQRKSTREQSIDRLLEHMLGVDDVLKFTVEQARKEKDKWEAAAGSFFNRTQQVVQEHTRSKEELEQAKAKMADTEVAHEQLLESYQELQDRHQRFVDEVETKERSRLEEERRKREGKKFGYLAKAKAKPSVYAVNPHSRTQASNLQTSSNTSDTKDGSASIQTASATTAHQAAAGGVGGGGRGGGGAESSPAPSTSPRQPATRSNSSHVHAPDRRSTRPASSASVHGSAVHSHASSAPRRPKTGSSTRSMRIRAARVPNNAQHMGASPYLNPFGIPNNTPSGASPNKTMGHRRVYSASAAQARTARDRDGVENTKSQSLPPHDTLPPDLPVLQALFPSTPAVK